MRILLAVDKSEFADAAVNALIRQFSPKDNEIRVFHAVDWEERLPPPYLFAQGPEAAQSVIGLRDRMLQEADGHVNEIAGRLRASGFTVTTEVSPEGHPSARILDAAAGWPADLIVLGSHGRSGLDRFLLGSVSDRVVRHAPCSVEVVRRNG
jgi:nucleotide-binding universal stress UspA family protein